MFFQFQKMVCTSRKIFFVVRDKEQGLARQGTEGLDNVLGPVAVMGVKTVEGLVEDEQVGILDESPCQQHPSLLSTREQGIFALGESVDVEELHPTVYFQVVFIGEMAEQAHRIVQSTGHNVSHGHGAAIGAIHFGAHVANVFLDVPNALAGAASATEERDVTSIGLRIVGTDQAEQG